MGDGAGVALARPESPRPTNVPSSVGPLVHSCPWICSETSCVATFGEGGTDLLNSDGGMAFVKLICKQSPTFARSTIGRGRL